jgi:hypothetical protein
MTPQEFKFLTEQTLYLRREMAQVMAGQLALVQYVIALSEKTAGTDARQEKAMLEKLTQQALGEVLATIENKQPALAAFLDTRTQEDVEEESDKPVQARGQGVHRAVDIGRLAAVQDILRAIAKGQP